MEPIFGSDYGTYMIIHDIRVKVLKKDPHKKY